MPSFGAVSKNDLIRYLKQIGFDDPLSGVKHQYMIKDELKLTIPNPHKSDISVGLLSRILRQADITREEWEAL